MSDDTVLRLERLFPTPPERLFELWTEPAELVKWWGPEGYNVPEYALDVRPGGAWWTTIRSSDGTRHKVSGVYRVIEKPRLLVFTWAWDDDSGVRGRETEVTVTFEQAPGGTRLVLRQQAFENRESRDNHRKGWSSSFDCLARVAA